MFPSGTGEVLILTEGMSGAVAEGSRCSTEILINTRLRSDAFPEERLKDGWAPVFWFLASFVP